MKIKRSLFAAAVLALLTAVIPVSAASAHGHPGTVVPDGPTQCC